MPVLELRFSAGRYHATAWGRNVNEGAPEWPPSPFRLARALLDIWYRRHSEIGADEVEGALTLLSGVPKIAVPFNGSKMALKMYQDQNRKEHDKQAVLDAFVCLEKNACCYFSLPDNADAGALSVLATLLGELNYLGRSESWVDARLLDSLPDGVVWNCLPEENGILIYSLLSVDGYEALPFQPTSGKGTTERICSWLEALSLSTAVLQEEGWNRHPLLSRTHYLIENIAEKKQAELRSETEGICFTYALRATPLPNVTHGLALAERVRAALMSRHRKICGGDPALVSSLFSGKSLDGRPLTGHRHAFYLPCDLDADGRIDHVRVIAPQGVTGEERRALESLRRLWVHGADLGELVLLHARPISMAEKAAEVVSATPVVFARHYKKRDGDFSEWLAKEVSRCCREVGLPAPCGVEIESNLKVGDGITIPWSAFSRGRKGAIPARGYGFRLSFEEPIPVPFAIGSLAHFGLGLFTQYQEHP